jgi:hypothetical protein
MKKKVLFLAIFTGCTLLLGSCFKGEDLEILRHPLHVQGDIEPSVGVPIAYGDLSVNDVLTMLGGNNKDALDSVIDKNKDIITLKFSYSYGDTIISSSKKKSAPRAPRRFKDDDTWWSKDTSIVTTWFDIPLFENTSVSGLIDSTDIKFQQINLNLDLGMKGQCSPTMSQYLRAAFDSIRLFYVDHWGNTQDFEGLHGLGINVTDMNVGDSIKTTINIAEIANAFPRRVQVQARMHLYVSKGIIDHAINELSLDDLVDSLNSWVSMTTFQYHTDIDIDMPLVMKVNKLDYSYDTTFTQSFNIDSLFNFGENVEVTLKDSKLLLYAENGIPLSMNLGVSLLDAKGNHINDLMNNENLMMSITEGQIVEGYTVNVTKEARLDTLSVPLSQKLLDDMKLAKRIQFSLGLRTDNKYVALRKSDFMKMRIALQLNPSAKIDIPVLDRGLLQ